MGDAKVEVGKLDKLDDPSKWLRAFATYFENVTDANCIVPNPKSLREAATALEAQQAEIAELKDDLLFESGRGDDRDAAVKLVGEQQAEIERLRGLLNAAQTNEDASEMILRRARASLANKDTDQ